MLFSVYSMIVFFITLSRRPQASYSQPSKQEESSKKKDQDDEDNWNMPDADFPYWPQLAMPF